MAINGVTVKSVKTFKGHEGETLLQGNVYLKGKKLGFWSNDFYNGPDNFDFDINLLYKPYMAVRKVLPDSIVSEIYDASNLIATAIALQDVEKIFNAEVKKGNAGIYIAFDVGSGSFVYSVIEKEYAIPEKIELLLRNKLNIAIEPIFGSFAEYKPYVIYTYISKPEDLDFVIGDIDDIEIPKTKEMPYVRFESPKKIEKFTIKEIDSETVEFKDSLYKKAVLVPKKDVEIVKKVLDALL